MHEDIVKKLEDKFPGADVEVVDTSAGHESHNALYNIMVSVMWSGFEGKTLIEQHQMVHEVLKEELKTKVHALRLKTGSQ